LIPIKPRAGRHTHGATLVAEYIGVVYASLVAVGVVVVPGFEVPAVGHVIPPDRLPSPRGGVADLHYQMLN
jgi:hypothetical protein